MKINNKLALLLAGTLALTNPLGAHAKIENSSFDKVVSTESSQDAFQYIILIQRCIIYKQAFLMIIVIWNFLIL